MALVCGTSLSAQSGGTFSGVLVNSLSGDPVADASLVLEELRVQAVSGKDGSFSFPNVPPGSYHIAVRAQGYSSRRLEVTAPMPAGSLTLPVDPELHFEEVTSVSAEARSQFETFQPTSVLAGQELSKQLSMSLGATLEDQPGVASRSFGPAPARPVIRGLDGDRVLILQDGQRMGDLSSQSGDHGVVVNPAAAQRIEVVRGPATLLYGANAIGGLVNVITDEIPTTPLRGSTGNLTFDLGSGAREGGGAGDVHVGNGSFVMHVGGGGRRSGDVRTPAGTVANSQSRNGFGNVGVAWTSANRYAGASYGYDDTKYGTPVVEGGNISLTPRRHAVSVRAGGEKLDGPLDSYRVTLAVRRYKHDELNLGEVETAFTNNTEELEVMGGHRAIGRLKGSAGGWFLNRAFNAAGDEALSPAVDQRGLAAFVYEEAAWSHFTLQFGGRIDHARYTPTGESERTFTTGSGSLGALYRPAAAADRLVFAASLARAARYPALEELFYYGLHAGNFAFEVGQPNLQPEHALGFDLSVRWQLPRASGEVTYFRNAIDGYIFRRPLSAAQFAGRLPAYVDRFDARDDVAERGEEVLADPEALPIVEYVAEDSVLQGVEAHSDLTITSHLTTELGIDYVRGSLVASGDPLPRLPPLRGRIGLRYQVNAFQAGGDLTLAGGQDRVPENETVTAGYQLVKLFAAYSFGSGRTVQTITARVDNVTNEDYRNHLSLIKDLVPEMGRSLKVLYNVRF
jgi:iron complex outermembrane receptor protein